MASESKFGQMVPVTRETGRTIEHKDSESSLTSMETSTRVTGSTTRPMEKECIFMLTERDTKVNGWMIFNMAMEKNLGQMAQYMKDSTSQERNTEEVCTVGTTDLSIMATGKRTRLKVLEHTHGWMEDSTRVNG